MDTHTERLTDRDRDTHRHRLIDRVIKSSTWKPLVMGTRMSKTTIWQRNLVVDGTNCWGSQRTEPTQSCPSSTPVICIEIESPATAQSRASVRTSIPTSLCYAKGAPILEGEEKHTFDAPGGSPWSNRNRLADLNGTRQNFSTNSSTWSLSLEAPIN